MKEKSWLWVLSELQSNLKNESIYKKAAIYIQIVSNIKHYCTLQVKLCVRPYCHQETLIRQLMNSY